MAEARYAALEYRLRADQEEHSMATRDLEQQLMETGDSISALQGDLEQSRATQVGRSAEEWVGGAFFCELERTLNGTIIRMEAGLVWSAGGPLVL